MKKDRIKVRITDAKPPYRRRIVPGYLPFKIFGELFVVTKAQSILGVGWRATHYDTGAAVPDTFSTTKEGVEEKTQRILVNLGETRLRKAIAEARRIAIAARKVA